MVDDMSAIIPRSLHESLAWLGRLNWHDYRVVANERGTPILQTGINWPAIIDNPDATKHRALVLMLQNIAEAGYDALAISQIEACSYLLATGPKLFQPTEEQFESMAHVEIRMPLDEFVSPFPALVVRIPADWRRRTAAELGIDSQSAPRHVVVRHIQRSDRPSVLFTSTRWREVEIAHLVGERMSLPTIEDCLVSRQYNKVDEMFPGPEGEYTFSTLADRAAINMCLMLTHYGCRLGNYLDEKRHRRNCKEQSTLRFGDYRSVDMIQHVVIRRESNHQSIQQGEDDPNRTKLWEVKPHWRRGYWRRKPGHKHYEDLGQKPPLVFVRPTLVRRDRVQGDIGESQATYRTG